MAKWRQQRLVPRSSYPRMIAHPIKGKPFLMAILDCGVAEERAKAVWRSSAHLYVQKLSHYTIEKDTSYD
jgi:hypothetical protein